MSIKKFAAIACAIAMSATMLTACGDTEESSSKSEATSTTTEETSSAAEESEEDSAEESAEDESSVAEVEEPEYLTEFTGYDAFLMFGDSSWLWGNWNGTGYEDADAFGMDADVTGDGEYTVSITKTSIAGTTEKPNANVATDENTGYPCAASGCVVFCVDITGICDGTTNYKGEEVKKNKLKDGDDANVNKETKGAYTGQELTVTVTSIKADGEEVEFDASKIVYGNIEDNNNCYRIEIYNDYGDTKDNSPIDKNSLAFEEELSVTFTIEGLGTIPTFAGSASETTSAVESAAESAAEDSAAESTVETAVESVAESAAE